MSLAGASRRDGHARISSKNTASSSTPPPLPPKDLARQQLPPLSTSLVSNSPSPTRVRRKPLAAAATVSPNSIVSSPGSLYSQYADDHSREVTAPASTAVLHQVLDASSRPRSSSQQSFYLEATPTTPTEPPVPSPPRPLPSPGQAHGPPASVPVKDFPFPPAQPLPEIREPHDEPKAAAKQEVNMATARNGERPPPLRMEPIKAVSALKTLDAKKPQSPGSVFTSFFGRKQQATSPQNTSPSDTTEISDGRSPAPSPYPGSGDEGYFHQSPQVMSRSLAIPDSAYGGSSHGRRSSDVEKRCTLLEVELKEISKELALSIRRELDLEDLVERLQSDAPPMTADRTSDYFSDSGASSVRHNESALTPKEEIDKIKRESEQQKAQLRIDMSAKWQEEVAQRKLLETHVSALEERLSHTRRDTNETSDASSRVKELEVALEEHRRKLMEERATKENFEDLLTALKVDLEQHRNERDNLRDEILPSLRAQIEGLEVNAAEHQRQPYDYARMQQEIQHLKDENAAITSARKIEQEMMRQRGMNDIAEDDDLSAVRSSLVLPKGLGRSSTVSGRGNARLSLTRPGSLSRANSTKKKDLPDTPESIADKLNAVEQQRDALHTTAKYLRYRLQAEHKKSQREIERLQAALNKSNNFHEGRRGGYASEVRGLRQEVNMLRQRADDALEQKYQCEKGLAGLKMDLDRSKQETESLQKLLTAQGSDDPEVLSAALQQAVHELQVLRKRGQTQPPAQGDQKLVSALKNTVKKSEQLEAQVCLQLENNAELRDRLKSAIEHGQKNQTASATQIGRLQTKLKFLEDAITSAQIQSETAVMRHEEELRLLMESHIAQLQRAKAGIRSPGSPAKRSPMSPMFANSTRSPRLDQTSSGPGQSLNEAFKTDNLQRKVSELEKALNEAENGMEQVVGRMNHAQISVFELQQQRDDALQRTKALETEVRAERNRFNLLVTGGENLSSL